MAIPKMIMLAEKVNKDCEMISEMARKINLACLNGDDLTFEKYKLIVDQTQSLLLLIQATSTRSNELLENYNELMANVFTKK